MSEPKLHPILFSTPMVQAILNGTKTQTRRVMKPQPIITQFEEELIDKNLEELNKLLKMPYNKHVKNPYGQPGDILWVRETFYAWGKWIKNGFTKSGKQKWKFIDSGISWKYEDSKPGNVRRNSFRKLGWYKRPSIHMPGAACRLFLQIKSIRVERLQSITEQDAKAEGVEFIPGKDYSYKHYLKPGYDVGFDTAYYSFKSLWISINEPESWDANPWVWVIQFERFSIKPTQL